MPVVHDTFSDHSGTEISDHTPDIGGPWIEMESLNEPRIYDDRLEAQGLSPERWVVDTGISDCTIIGQLHHGPTSGSNFGIVFRSIIGSGSDDSWLLFPSTNSWLLIRYSTEGGTFQQSNSSLGSNLDLTRSVKIILDGVNIKCYVDDTLLFDWNSTYNQTGVFHGIYCQNSDGNWIDDFAVFACDSQWLEVDPTQEAGFVEISP